MGSSQSQALKKGRVLNIILEENEPQKRSKLTSQKTTDKKKKSQLNPWQTEGKIEVSGEINKIENRKAWRKSMKPKAGS